MGENSLFDSSGKERDYAPLSILKITIPINVYNAEERKAIYESVKSQVGKYYLPVGVPEDVKLEIINAF